MKITPPALEAALAWIESSPLLRDVLWWHAAGCPGCIPFRPVKCPEYAEIIGDYSIAVLAMPPAAVPE